MGRLRTSIYIDGFNFYYGFVKDTPYKWLDFKALFEKALSPRNEIKHIKYFTAIVTGDRDPNQPIRQQTYIRALEKHIPELSVYYGYFLSHEKKLPRAQDPQKQVKVIKTEEKGSDVNLAVHLLNDAWKNAYDCAVVVSNDSDLAGAIELVKNEHGKKIGVVFTRVKKRPQSQELRKLADFIKPIGPNLLKSSQLPLVIPDSNLTKPTGW